MTSVCKILEVEQVGYYTEICCKLCNKPIHNHFSCPVCKKDKAGTSIWGDIRKYKEFKCLECNTNFKLIKIINKNKIEIGY